MDQIFLEKIQYHENKMEEFQKKLNNERKKEKIDKNKIKYLEANYHYNDGIVFGLKVAMKMIENEN